MSRRGIWMRLAKGVVDLLRELHRDGATIVVTHSAKMAQRAEREVRIVDGTVVRQPLLGSSLLC